MKDYEGHQTLRCSGPEVHASHIWYDLSTKRYVVCLGQVLPSKQPEPEEAISDLMLQRCPTPHELEEMVKSVRYKPDWVFMLLDEMDRGQGSKGLTLVITITTPDSYHPEKIRTVAHLFPVPPAAYDWRSWQRWLFDQILLVERHEAMEFFQLVEHDAGLIGHRRPYAPSHGPGNDPYLIREVGTTTDVRTSYKGVEKG